MLWETAQSFATPLQTTCSVMDKRHEKSCKNIPPHQRCVAEEYTCSSLDITLNCSEGTQNLRPVFFEETNFKHYYKLIPTLLFVD